MPAVMAGQFSFKCLNVQDSPSTFLGGKHSGKTLLSLPRVARNSSSMLILPAAWHDLSGKVGDPSSRATYTNMSLWIIMHHMFVSSSIFLKAPHPSSIKDFSLNLCTRTSVGTSVILPCLTADHDQDGYCERAEGGLAALDKHRVCKRCQPSQKSGMTFPVTLLRLYHLHCGLRSWAVRKGQDALLLCALHQDHERPEVAHKHGRTYKKWEEAWGVLLILFDIVYCPILILNGAYDRWFSCTIYQLSDPFRVLICRYTAFFNVLWRVTVGVQCDTHHIPRW